MPVASSRWFAIQNHLHQALGRQAYNLGRSDEALVYYLSLLGKAEQEGDVETGEDDQGVWDDFKLALDVSHLCLICTHTKLLCSILAIKRQR